MQLTRPDDEPVVPLDPRRVDHDSPEFKVHLERVKEIAQAAFDTLDVQEERENERPRLEEYAVFVVSALRGYGPLAPWEIFALGFAPGLSYESRKSAFKDVILMINTMLVDENGDSMLTKIGNTNARLYALKNSLQPSMPADVALTLREKHIASLLEERNAAQVQGPSKS